jgi:hypothetical protein
MAIPGHGCGAAALGTKECSPRHTAQWPRVIACTIRAIRPKLAHYSLTAPPLGGLISGHAFAQSAMQPGRRQRVVTVALEQLQYFAHTRVRKEGLCTDRTTGNVHDAHSAMRHRGNCTCTNYIATALLRTSADTHFANVGKTNSYQVQYWNWNMNARPVICTLDQGPMVCFAT